MGLVSESEKSEVRDWLSDPENQFKCERYLKNLWVETDEDDHDPPQDLEVILDRVHHKINLLRDKEKSRSWMPRRTPSLPIVPLIKNAARVAAIVMLPLMGYLAWEVYSQKLWIRSQSEVGYNEIICPLGSRSQFELPDGTKGNLNNGSRLKYPSTFNGNTREVELAGEAFFDVSHNKTRPFIIRTDGLDVKVTGTRLNVYSYPDEGYQEFTLESGSIELISSEYDQDITVAKLKPGQHVVYSNSENMKNIASGDNDLTLERIQKLEIPENLISSLKQGQEAAYELNHGTLAVKVDETQHYTSWREGKLVLRNDPMQNLLTRIERWYNVKFNVLDNSINEYTYRATFEEENLDQVLELLSLTGPIAFEKLPKLRMDDGSFKIQEINVKLKTPIKNR
jgi:ferric-dicitrate binding protein FerR (iron transport regulator)